MRKGLAVLLLVILTVVFIACNGSAGSDTDKASQTESKMESAADAEAAVNSGSATGTESTAVAESVATETADTVTTESSEEETITWEELYEQGLEYFSNEQYEEAITAFTEAIGINAEQASVYIGRGDAYVLREAPDEKAVESNLNLAWMDYETASTLDQTSAEAYLGMADVLIRQEEFDEAHELLVSVQASVSDQTKLLGKIQEIEAGTYTDSSSQIRRKDAFDPDGNLSWYTIYEYDGLGRKSGWRNYYTGSGLTEYCVVTFGDNGLAIRNDFYKPDGTQGSYQTMEYDENGLEIRRDIYSQGEHVAYYITYYDEEGKETGYDGFYADGTMFGYWESEYDNEGNFIQEYHYNPDGTLVEIRKPTDE